jgi:hypothetical protein
MMLLLLLLKEVIIIAIMSDVDPIAKIYLIP